MIDIKRRFLLLLLIALLPGFALGADAIVDYHPTGLSLYARFDDGANKAINLTEGSTLNLGRYSTTSAAVTTLLNGVSAGNYTYRICVGTASGQSSTDASVGAGGPIKWNGTVLVAGVQSQQDVRDALNDLAPTNGSAATNSVDAKLATSGGGATVTAIDADDDHVWGFDDRSQVTSPNIITENIGFNGPCRMNFTRPIGKASVFSIGAVTVSPATGGLIVAPTLGSASLNLNKTGVVQPIDDRVATAGTYTISITITTTDSRTFVRKGTHIVH